MFKTPTPRPLLKKNVLQQIKVVVVYKIVILVNKTNVRIKSEIRQRLFFRLFCVALLVVWTWFSFYFAQVIKATQEEVKSRGRKLCHNVSFLVEINYHSNYAELYILSSLFLNYALRLPGVCIPDDLATCCLDSSSFKILNKSINIISLYAAVLSMIMAF